MRHGLISAARCNSCPALLAAFRAVTRIGVGEKEANMIVTLLVAAGAVLLAVLGRALLAPNDEIRL